MTKLLKIVLTDWQEIMEERYATQEEYEELSRKAYEATAGNWTWEIKD